MPSLETLELISYIAWRTYGRVNKFLEKFWMKKPIHWDDKTKTASFRKTSDCLPYTILMLCQIPAISYSFLIMFRQLNPKYSDPRFPLSGVVIVAFGSALNFFISVGCAANYVKKKEWALCLNVIAREQFHKKTKGAKKPASESWAKSSFWRNWSIADIISDGVFGVFLSMASAGFSLPFVVAADPIAYYFIDIPVHSREWYIIKHLVRPVCWLFWSFYCTWTFYIVTANIFFVILHGCMKIPRVPKSSKSQKLTVIQNSIGNTTFGQKLAIRLMEGAYKEYRQFQVFIRPANDAAYISIPDGLMGLSVTSVICGFAAIKGYHIFPINVFALFPTCFCVSMSIIAFMIPIACNVFESAVDFKRYWLSRFLRKEVRRRLISLRPMGIAAGPFGYIHRSLPMQLTDAIVDFICSLSMSTSL